LSLKGSNVKLITREELVNVALKKINLKKTQKRALIFNRTENTKDFPVLLIRMDIV